MMFCRYTEENAHEGETWTFWLQLANNWPAIDDLVSILNEDEEVSSSSVYILEGDVVLDERSVDTLCEYGGSGYMDYHHKVTGRLVIPPAFDPDDLYKGRITELFHSDPEDLLVGEPNV